MHRVQEKSLQYIFCITLTMLNTVPEFLARIIPKLHFTKIKNLSDTLAYDHGLACAVATGCYINDVLCQWEFRPPPLHSSHIFQTIFLKLNPERYPGDRPACKIWFMSGGDICKKSAFWRSSASFLYSSLHLQVTPQDGEIQDGGGRHCEKNQVTTINRSLLNMLAPESTKGLNDLLQIAIPPHCI